MFGRGVEPNQPSQKMKPLVRVVGVSPDQAIVVFGRHFETMSHEII
jgi:hypothetical protein